MQFVPGKVAQCSPIQCSGFHAASLNAVDSMQHGKMHPDGTQCIPCSVAKWIPIECSGFDAACPNGYRENAVDSMQCGAMDFN